MAKRGPSARRLAVQLARTCAENRCRDVTVLDLRKLSPVTDFFVLATGTSGRQMAAVAHLVRQAGAALGDKPASVEGVDSGFWVLLDYFSVVVHVFSEDARRYYDMELLWGDAPRIDWAKGWTPGPPPEADGPSFDFETPEAG